MINKPTRITTHSSTLLDHIYTNIVTDQIQSGILTYDISDHLPTFCFIPRRPKLRYEKRMRRCTKNFNSDLFLLDTDKIISNLESNLYRDNWDPEDAMNSLLNAFTALINSHLPLKAQSKKASKLATKPWITKGILNSIKTKNKLFRKCYKQNKRHLIKQYKLYLNKLTSIKRIAKQQYYYSQITTNRRDSAKVWKNINEIIGMKKKNCEKPITKLLNKNNKCIENRQEMTEEFNDFFLNIGPTLANKIPSANICNPIVDSSSHQNSFFLEPISPIEVFREIMHLKENKANGPENIPTKYIKLASELLAPMLCNIFNQCLIKGKFPKNLKIAKIKPIHKSGLKELMTNYRPISMLSPFAKIFERLINTRLTSYLSQFNIINQEQFGFQKEHSTSLLIADVISQIKILKEKKTSHLYNIVRS